MLLLLMGHTNMLSCLGLSNSNKLPPLPQLRPSKLKLKPKPKPRPRPRHKHKHKPNMEHSNNINETQAKAQHQHRLYLSRTNDAL